MRLILRCLALALLPSIALAVCPVGDFAGCRVACERGEPDSCTRLAAIYRDGRQGVARDDRHAVELLQRACRTGSTSGCADLQRMRAEGRGVGREPAPEPAPAPVDPPAPTAPTGVVKSPGT